MTAPTFICVGPGRTGTSWLREMLEQHPDVAMSTLKETEYYNNHRERPLSWYLDHFPESNATAIGEISNMYYVDGGIAAAIHRDFPGIKIVFSVRDSRELLESFYKFGIRRGCAAVTLQSALDESIGKYMGTGFQQRKEAGNPVPADRVTLFDAVLLSQWLGHYVAVFDPSQIFILNFSRIAEEPQVLLKELYEFLGVDPTFVPEGVDEVINQAVRPRNVLLARIAHQAAYLLRKMGFHRTLASLHKSRLLKRLLFRSSKRQVAESSSEVSLDAEHEAMLRAEETALQRVLNDLQRVPREMLADA